jgi:hypothetical protein
MTAWSATVALYNQRNKKGRYHDLAYLETIQYNGIFLGRTAEMGWPLLG